MIFQFYQIYLNIVNNVNTLLLNLQFTFFFGNTYYTKNRKYSHTILHNLKLMWVLEKSTENVFNYFSYPTLPLAALLPLSFRPIRLEDCL